MSLLHRWFSKQLYLLNSKSVTGFFGLQMTESQFKLAEAKVEGVGWCVHSVPTGSRSQDGFRQSRDLLGDTREGQRKKRQEQTGEPSDWDTLVGHRGKERGKEGRQRSFHQASVRPTL